MRLCLLLAFCAWIAAAETVPVKPATPPAKSETEPSADLRPPEEAWVFDPSAGRLDLFADVETTLALEAQLRETPNHSVVQISHPGAIENDKAEDAIKWARLESERIEKLILARRWSEAIAGCDNAAKTLDKYGVSNQTIVDLRETVARFRNQAVEAQIFEEAQSQFDALGIAVEGVLWAPEGSLAVIAGEPRALKVNDHTRGCTIVNIDTNRVDFLFTTEQKRRFEFQRYVGEAANGKNR
jgi:hypothetical protein